MENNAMRYTRIEVIGETGATAVLTRHPKGAKHIEVEITAGATVKRHSVIADDRDDQWSMAECLQQTLDGFRGAGGDIRDYFAAIQHLAD